MRSISSPVTAVAVAMLGCSCPAFGADIATSVAPVSGHGSASSADAPEAMRSRVPVTTRLGTPLSGEALQSMRGGDNTTTNNVDIHGGVDGNTANNIVSGTNIIQDGSFANASGISTVIQNSGSNVLIQNGMVVNVQFVDPGL